MKHTRFTWLGVPLVMLGFAVGSAAQAQDDAKAATTIALDLLTDNNARGAVAVLADAARRYPQDRKIGALLYTLLRDKRWPVGQTLPVKLSAAVTVVDFSSDAKLVIAGAEDGTVRLLDVESGRLLDATVKHPGSIVNVAILPGNELAFSVGRAGVARIWRIADGKVEREWSNKDSAFTAAAVSKDFKHIALGYENGDARVYDRESGEEIGEAIKHTKAITGLVFSPDGQALATASADGSSRVWQLATGKPRDFVVKHNGPLRSVDFGRLGILLLTASDDGIAKITDATSGAPIIPDLNCGAAIRDARLSPSGIRFHTVLDDHTVRIWDSFTGKPVEGVIRTDDGIVSADWGPAGMRMVTASDGPLADLWRVRDGQQIAEGMLHETPVRVAAYGPNARLIATGCADGTLRVWRQDVGAASEGLPTVRKHYGAVRTAFFSADGKGLVSCADDFTAVRWNLETTRPIGRALPQEGKPVCAVYSPDRSFVATVTEGGKAFVFDGKSGEPHGSPLNLGAPGRWIDFHKDGRLFITTAGAKAVVWTVDDAHPSGAAIEHPRKGKLNMARFSPDGKLIVTAGADGTARIWNSDSRKLVATLKKHEGAVTTARFSFDSKMLVTTGADGSIVAWDTATWKQTGTTMLLPGEIWSAVIGPNKQFVAATSQLSNGVRFFDIETGRPFTDGIDLPADAVSIDLNPDGDVLAVASADATVKTYGSPFVTEDTPNWMPEFAERIVGIRVDRPGTFAPVYASYDQLKQYPPAAAAPGSDFAMLAKWMVTFGVDRTTSPRTFATIASNVQRCVEERSLEALYEIYEAAPANPLIFAAMSLYVPTQRQGEYLAEYALERSANDPIAQAYVASTFAKYRRMDEAERVMKTALAATPNDHRVLRRAARLDVLQGRKDEAIAKMERAVADDREDAETFRSYGWVLYNLGEPAKAMEQFSKASELTGGADEDVLAGICLVAAATGDKATATTRYQRLINRTAEWGDPKYIKNLTGWTEKELSELERIRALAAAKR
jgi:WD40 repeat protein/Tfp pilus assembly protein PilF